MKYRSTLNESLEAAGIAYNTACIYAIGELNDAHWEDVRRKSERSEFARMDWEPTPKLVSLKGARGKEALRFAWMDASGAYLRFRSGPRAPVYSSVALLKATVHEPLEFIRQRLSGTFLAARKPMKSNWQGRGLHVGSLESSFSALLVIEPLDADQRRLRILDVQPEGRGVRHELTRTTALSPDEEAAQREVFREFVETAAVIPEPTINTLLLFGSRLGASVLVDQSSGACAGCPASVSI
jgi:hypothetical protein